MMRRHEFRLTEAPVDGEEMGGSMGCCPFPYVIGVVGWR
jgi:hypothetical protein